jgi:TPR repeat protein
MKLWAHDVFWRFAFNFCDETQFDFESWEWTEENHGATLDFFLKRAKAGNRGALMAMGRAYERGKGPRRCCLGDRVAMWVPEDKIKSLTYRFTAAVLGHPKAGIDIACSWTLLFPGRYGSLLLENAKGKAYPYPIHAKCFEWLKDMEPTLSPLQKWMSREVGDLYEIGVGPDASPDPGEAVKHYRRKVAETYSDDTNFYKKRLKSRMKIRWISEQSVS